jgi:hypothetical protein
MADKVHDSRLIVQSPNNCNICHYIQNIIVLWYWIRINNYGSNSKV